MASEGTLKGPFKGILRGPFKNKKEDLGYLGPSFSRRRCSPRPTEVARRRAALRSLEGGGFKGSFKGIHKGSRGF